MNTNWNATTKHLVGVGLVLFGIYLLYLSLSVLTLVILAALIAFLLNPIVAFFNNKLKLPRGAAVLVTYLLAIIVIVLSPLIFMPPIVSGFNLLADIDYVILIESSLNWLEQTLISLKQLDPKALGFNFKLDPVVDPALNLLQDAGQDINLSFPSFETIINSLQSAVSVTFGVATNVAGTVFSAVFTFIVLVLSAIYISLDGHHFVQRLVAISPPAYQAEMMSLKKRLNKIWRAYFRGQLNLMIIIGVVTWLGTAMLGLPGAFALGVIAGILELIPNLGPFLAVIPAVVVALIQGSTYLTVSNWVFALIILGFYLLVQQFENTFVVPRILGGAVDLHPLVVIIGVLIGANVGGILGALLAAPVIASGREIVRYLYAKILGEPPFPQGQNEAENVEVGLWNRAKILMAKIQAYRSTSSVAPPPTTEDASTPGADKH